MRTEIQFDEATHRYTLDGKPVPSVTQIINEVLGSGFGFIAADHGDWLKQRGRAVHHAAQLIAQGKDFEYDEQIAGQVQALRQWYADVKPVIHRQELMLFSTMYRFAGRPDFLGAVGRVKVVGDFKGSMDVERLTLQLGAYSILADDGYNHGIGVEIKPDGYRMTKLIDLKRARNEFLALRSVFSIRERLKLTKEQHAD